MPARTQARARMGLLDSVMILVLACMVALIVLWISAETRGIDQFSRLPAWLTKAADSFWTYITGAASSSLLAILRRRSRDPKPNYLLWIFGTAALLLSMVFVIGSVLPTPLPRSALLKFSLICDANDHPNLSFSQRRPSYREPHTIGAEADGHYQEYVDFPAENAHFYARMVRTVTTSEASNHPLNPVTEVCFKRKPEPPGNGAPLEVRLNCPEGKRCSTDADDPGWAEMCSSEGDWTRLFRLVPVVYADSSLPAPGWKVPSLDTLRKMTDRERVGYTEFTIKSAQLGALNDAETVQYLIKVNGSPLYVDGWAPEDMLIPFDAARAFEFSFGLENLSFSGADDGCEDIELGLSFRQRDRVIKQILISRKYAALRDANPEAVKAQDGTTFTWSGKYVKPNHEDKTELFVLSTTDLREAKSVKTRIDAAKLVYNGMGIVGVLRPPLDNTKFGIVVGLRQPTGQIRFTYDTLFGQNLRAWIASQKVQGRSLLRRDVFLYQMRSGDSGMGSYSSCNAIVQ